MKFAVALLLIFSPSLSYSDAGISVSYRSTPVIIEKNWLNDSKWPEEFAYYEGITTQRSLNMVTINLYFDDSLKAIFYELCCHVLMFVCRYYDLARKD